MDTRIETDCSTGESIIISLTQEEIDERNYVNLDKYKSDKINELSVACSNAIELGFYSDLSPTVKHFFSFAKDPDQLNFGQKASMLALNPNCNEIVWKTEDAGILTFTRDEFMKILQDGENHKMGNISKQWTLKAQVLASETKDQIDTIVNNVVW